MYLSSSSFSEQLANSLKIDQTPLSQYDFHACISFYFVCFIHQLTEVSFLSISPFHSFGPLKFVRDRLEFFLCLPFASNLFCCVVIRITERGMLRTTNPFFACSFRLDSLQTFQVTRVTETKFKIKTKKIESVQRVAMCRKLWFSILCHAETSLARVFHVFTIFAIAKKANALSCKKDGVSECVCCFTAVTTFSVKLAFEHANQLRNVWNNKLKHQLLINSMIKIKGS